MISRILRGLIPNSKPKKQEKKELGRVTSSQKDILKSIFSLPVQYDWLSDDVIEKIERDSTVAASKGSRKAATLKKEILITCDNEEITKELQKAFNFNLQDSILDIPFQGFGVYEINWTEKNTLFFPKLKERNYQEFVLEDEVLMYQGEFGTPTEIPPYKSIHAIYKPKPKKPYGQPLYFPLFWCVQFKNASLEFWMEFLERFGNPWVVGKTDGDKDILADEIYNMLGGDGAVLEQDDDLEIKTPDKSGNFKELIEYLDNQIREVILGGNLTGEVKGGSHAATSVHNDIREDLAKADENILQTILTETVHYFLELNGLDDEILVKIKDKDDPNKELADRDKVLHEIGYRVTKEYIEKTYNVEVEEIKEVQQESTGNFFPNSMKFSKNLPADELEINEKAIDTKELLFFQKQVIETIANATSYEDLQEKLYNLYGEDHKDLEENLYRLIANSHILGFAEIEEENPNG